MTLWMLVSLLCFVSAACGWWTGAWIRRPHAPIVDPTGDPVDAAVRAAYTDLGLNPDDYHDGTDLVRTGKLYEILYHAAHRLGVDHELRTVGDVKRWLKE